MPVADEPKGPRSALADVGVVSGEGFHEHGEGAGALRGEEIGGGETHEGLRVAHGFGQGLEVALLCQFL